eukprot:TRINITY_DN2042_c0_g1_i4.p1 TRINITY_DN2042_c0_g1~~TRINITY_DN2042_c0_g1_i4.p1  ORF type:complete len:317 (-),score=-17.02 TRINITY_DN2042_c0_g1_i4:184-1134(-)
MNDLSAHILSQCLTILRFPISLRSDNYLPKRMCKLPVWLFKKKKKLHGFEENQELLNYLVFCLRDNSLILHTFHYFQQCELGCVKLLVHHQFCQRYLLSCCQSIFFEVQFEKSGLSGFQNTIMNYLWKVQGHYFITEPSFFIEECYSFWGINDIICYPVSIQNASLLRSYLFCLEVFCDQSVTLFLELSSGVTIESFLLLSSCCYDCLFLLESASLSEVIWLFANSCHTALGSFYILSKSVLSHHSIFFAISHHFNTPEQVSVLNEIVNVPFLYMRQKCLQMVFFMVTYFLCLCVNVFANSKIHSLSFVSGQCIKG